MSDQRFAIVAATFYRDLAERLIAGAQASFAEAATARWEAQAAPTTPRPAEAAPADVFEVPGAFELPLAAKYLAESGRYTGIACVGAVIRGQTDHYDFVCGEAARGIQDVQLSTGVPTAFGVLTVNDMDQALARSGGDKRDSGRHAADAVLALVALRQQLAGA
jgi:6,7-dimethyl-8-ribityllumazine synthase